MARRVPIGRCRPRDGGTLANFLPALVFAPAIYGVAMLLRGRNSIDSKGLYRAMSRICTRVWLLSVSVVFATALTAPMASAGTARTFGFFDFEGGYSEKIRFLANDGERNMLGVQDAGEIVVDELQATRLIRVTDRGAPLRPGPGCSKETAGSVICMVDGVRPTPLTARLGDRDDSLAVDPFIVSGIEATGGRGVDRLRGTGSSDVLDGGPGVDQIKALSGADLIRDADGGAADVLDAGRGRFDTVDYSGRRKDLRVDLAAELAIATGERDRLRGVENVITGTGDDVVFGDSGRSVFVGNAGSDTLLGSGGPDVLRGGHGRDDLHGHEGRDRLVGGARGDALFGGRGDDSIFARDRARDRVFGGRGRDRARLDPRLDRPRSVEDRF